MILESEEGLKELCIFIVSSLRYLLEVHTVGEMRNYKATTVQSCR